jgi:hypothetical protein
LSTTSTIIINDDNNSTIAMMSFVLEWRSCPLSSL